MRLPAMTAAELCVLGAMTSTLINAGAWDWWTSAPPQRQPVLRDMAWKFLASRDLVTPAGASAGTVRLAPAAALIVAARTRPAFIVLRRDSPGGEPEPARMYGIADQCYGLRAVMIEEAKSGSVGWAGPAYEFRLASPDEAAQALTRWATATSTPGQSRLIDIHQPGTRDTRPAERVSVQDSGTGWQVVREPGRLSVINPLLCDENVLTRLFTDTLTGACP